MKRECPTCGSEHKGIRLYTATLDPPSKVVGKITKKHADFVVEKGIWYGGYCPDVWHESTCEKGTR